MKLKMPAASAPAAAKTAKTAPAPKAPKAPKAPSAPKAAVSTATGERVFLATLTSQGGRVFYSADNAEGAIVGVIPEGQSPKAIAEANNLRLVSKGEAVEGARLAYNRQWRAEKVAASAPAKK